MSIVMEDAAIALTLVFGPPVPTAQSFIMAMYLHLMTEFLKTATSHCVDIVLSTTSIIGHHLLLHREWRLFPTTRRGVRLKAQKVVGAISKKMSRLSKRKKVGQ